MIPTCSRTAAGRWPGAWFVAAGAAAILAACGKPPEKPPAAPLDVGTISVEPQDVPVDEAYVAPNFGKRV